MGQIGYVVLFLMIGAAIMTSVLMMANKSRESDFDKSPEGKAQLKRLENSKDSL